MILAGTVITKSPREYGWYEAVVYVVIACVWLRLAPAFKTESEAGHSKV